MSLSVPEEITFCAQRRRQPTPRRHNFRCFKTLPRARRVELAVFTTRTPEAISATMDQIKALGAAINVWGPIFAANRGGAVGIELIDGGGTGGAPQVRSERHGKNRCWGGTSF